MPVDVEDPRLFSDRVDPAHAALMDLAQAALASTSTAREEAIRQALTRRILERLQSGESWLLADAVAAAPSPAIARTLWRSLIAAWSPTMRTESGIAVTLFALPLVIVAAVQSSNEEGSDAAALSAIVPDAGRLAAILREHGALSGNESFALSQVLVASDALDAARMSDLMAQQRMDPKAPAPDFPATPIAVPPGQQGVHLRFMLGTAVAAPQVDLLADAEVGKWGIPFARELAGQLAQPGVSVLALPRAPASPPAALQQGRAAQREVGAQLFASNAIRRLRATVGEPVAVISAHRCAGAPGGGELRLSLSSPLDPRQAEGFRCPLFATDRAVDVAGMLVDLLRDCRVADVRIFPGVHPDRDPDTGMILLLKPAAEGIEPTLH
jgi:hypothetical protein